MTMTPPPDNEYFSIKEWLASISSKLDRMEGKLEIKANQTDVETLATRLGAVERVQTEMTVRGQLMYPMFEETRKDVDILKDGMSRVGAVESYRRWLFGVVGLAMLSIVINVGKIFLP